MSENSTDDLSAASGNSEVSDLDYRELSYIKFPHRSVIDYIAQPLVSAELESASGVSFNAHVTLMQMHIALLKVVLKIGSGHLPPVVADVFWHNRFAEFSTGQAQDVLLDEMDRVLSLQHHTLSLSNMGPNIRSSGHWAAVSTRLAHHRVLGKPDDFLSMAIEWDATKYSMKVLDTVNGLPPRDGKPLLHYALPPDTIQLLLDRGADPNDTFYGRSPLQWLLFSLPEDEQFHRYMDRLGCATTLIRGGADPTVEVTLEDMTYSAQKIIEMHVIHGDFVSSGPRNEVRPPSS